MKSTKKLVIGALMAALTCIATMIIKIPTPTLGYIHLGDGLVLLCGIVLGPLGGALSAGIGSMFADIFSGYASWAPATLIIKALTAFVAGFLFHRMQHRFNGNGAKYLSIIWVVSSVKPLWYLATLFMKQDLLLSPVDILTPQHLLPVLLLVPPVFLSTFYRVLPESSSVWYCFRYL